MSAMPATEEVLARAMASFEAPAAALDAIARDFLGQLTRGLVGEPSSLKVLRTFTRQPTGRERGRVLVVDWGGSKGRAGLVELAGGGNVHLISEEVVTFSDEDKHAAADHVFDVIAAAVRRIVDAQAVSGACPLGFAYSYPARLERIDRAVALGLTKGWALSGIDGQDVATLLNEALERHGLSRIVVNAVANDTVAAMMLQSYRARGGDVGAGPADIGLILGTGTNQAADLGSAGIRNLESGNFDGVGPVETEYDAALDRGTAEPPPGAQPFEKMVSGHYLGEILRRVLADLSRVTPMFQWSAAPEFATPFGFDSEHLSRFEADRSSALSSVAAGLRRLDVESTLEERRAVRRLARVVVRRSARLVAAALVGTLRFLDPGLAGRHGAAVDGSLWGGYPGFERLVRDALDELIGVERTKRLEITFVKDSTSAGVAVIAAVAAQQRSE